ncbi:hypothetical protein [Flagellimonas onchidii]|uniref:hypothetical protein n=1 Tax=Flagellimonas onchidii TaxID=2562684 RepID=UPI0010A64E28|nr:hypothetical protein [Allomuricauda onchidii]
MVAASRLFSKYWIWVIVAIAISWGSIMLFFTGKSKEARIFDDIDEADSELTDLEANSIAQGLMKEFGGLGGSSGNEVIRLLGTVSLSGFKKIYKHFGKVRRDDILGGEGGWLFGNPERDLIYWLRAELSAREQSELRRANPILPI